MHRPQIVNLVSWHLVSFKYNGQSQAGTGHDPIKRCELSQVKQLYRPSRHQCRNSTVAHDSTMKLAAATRCMAIAGPINACMWQAGSVNANIKLKGALNNLRN